MDEKNNLITYVNIIVTILSISLLIFTLSLSIRDIYLETVSIKTNAAIISIDYNDDSRQATIAYVVNDIEYTPSISLKKNQYHLTTSDYLSIKYSIKNPSIIINNNHIIEIIAMLFISIIAIIITYDKSLKTIKKYLSFKTIKTNGVKINAKIIDVYNDVTIPKKNNNFPYRIRAKYLNPQDNKEYIFKSEYTYIDLKELLKDVKNDNINIYKEKKNTNIYYVDLKEYIESTKVNDEKDSTQADNSQKKFKKENK